MVTIEELPDEPTLIQRIPRSHTKKSINIPYDEQRRIVEESGVLKLSEQAERQNQLRRPESRHLVYESFAYCVLLVGVYSVLQYAFLMHFDEHRDLDLESRHVQDLLKRIGVGFPGLFCVVYYTHKFNRNRLMQLLLLTVSLVAGVWNMKLMTESGVTYARLRLSPALGTVWAYALMQLDLLYATSGLLLTMVLHIALSTFYYGRVST